MADHRLVYLGSRNAGSLPIWENKIETGLLGNIGPYNSRIVLETARGYTWPHLMQLAAATQDEPGYNIGDIVANIWSQETGDIKNILVFPSELPNGDTLVSSSVWQSFTMSTDGYVIALALYSIATGGPGVYLAYKVSSNYGRTWGSLQIFPHIRDFVYGDYKYCIEYDKSTGKFWVVFTSADLDGTSTTVVIYYSDNNGTSWSSGQYAPISSGKYIGQFSGGISVTADNPFSHQGEVSVSSWSYPPEGAFVDGGMNQWLPSPISGPSWWQVDLGSSPRILRNFTVTTAWPPTIVSNGIIRSTDSLSTFDISIVTNYTPMASGAYDGLGTFVFVGGGGIPGNPGVIRSTDNGSTWATYLLGTRFFRVIYDNSLFVAVGPNIVGSSSDGITWTIQSISTTGFANGVVYGNSLFVAVGGSDVYTGIPPMYYDFIPVVYTSPDGLTWTEQTSTGITDALFKDVTYGDGLFVATGNCSTGGVVYTSTDGISWARQTVPPSLYNLNHAAYGSGLFIITCGSNYIIKSSDGVNWVKQTINNFSDRFQDIIYGGGKFVITGESDTLLSSADGSTWVKEPAGSDCVLTGIIYGDGTYLIFSKGGDSPVVAPRDFSILSSNTGDFSGEEVELLSCSNVDWPGILITRSWDIVNDTPYRFYRVNIIKGTNRIGDNSVDYAGLNAVYMRETTNGFNGENTSVYPTYHCNDIDLNVSKFSLSVSEDNIYMLFTTNEGKAILSAYLTPVWDATLGLPLPARHTIVLPFTDVGVCKVTSTGSSVFIINVKGTKFQVCQSNDYGQNFSEVVEFDYDSLPISFNDQLVTARSDNSTVCIGPTELFGPVPPETNTLGLTGEGAISPDYYYLGYLVTRDYGATWSFELTPIEYASKSDPITILGTHQDYDVFRTEDPPYQWPLGKRIGDFPGSSQVQGSYNVSKDRLVIPSSPVITINSVVVDFNLKTATLIEESRFSVSPGYGTLNLFTDENYIYLCNSNIIYKYTWTGTLISTLNLATPMPWAPTFYPGAATSTESDPYYYVCVPGTGIHGGPKNGSIHRVRKSDFGYEDKLTNDVVAEAGGSYIIPAPPIFVDDLYVYCSNINRITGYNKITGSIGIEIYGYFYPGYFNWSRQLVPWGGYIIITTSPKYGGTIRIEYRRRDTGESVFSIPQITTTQKPFSAGPYWCAAASSNGVQFIAAPNSL
jgi:hypothetical protein